MTNTTSRILMVRPANFGYNPETAKDNAFQEEPQKTSALRIAELARQQFDQFVETLTAAGIQVMVVEDTDEPYKNDAVFPNNWITTHEDGTIVTYPMFTPSRRLERRIDIVQQLQSEFGSHRHITLEEWENQADMMLEGTGGLILDRPHRIAYACLSNRATEPALLEWGELMQYQVVPFQAADPDGQPIYHTNVIMALGETQAVLATQLIAETDRQGVLDMLHKTDKEVIEISWEQVQQFAGNMLQVRNDKGQLYWVMSSAAYQALTDSQREQLQSKGARLLHSDLEVIEFCGGGSARCMMAEIFL